MEIFVINLRDRKDRRDNIKRIFSKQGISNYSFITAVNGKELDNSIISKCRSWLQRAIYREGFLGSSEIGCALSHLKIYKKIVDENLEGALIFEDDVFFEKKIDLESIIKDAIALGKDKPIVLRLGGEVRAKKYKEFSLNGRSFIFAKNDCLGAYAYYINNRAANNLLKLLGDYPFIGIDMYKQLMTAVIAYDYKEKVCSYDDKITSDIENHRNDRYSELGIKFKIFKIYYQLRAVFVKRLFLPLYIKYKISR